MTERTTPRARLPRLTDRLELGDGLLVSPFCLGMTRWEDCAAAAFDAGINFFFVSADMHWPHYEGMRRSLARLLRRRKGIRDEVVVAAVSYPTQPEFCTAPFDEVVEEVPELEGRLDLLVIGGSYAGEFPTRLEVYRQHRRSRFLGARAIGCTFHDRAAAVLALNQSLTDLTFIRYNPGHAKARADFFPRLARSGRALLYNFKSTFAHVTPDLAARLGLDADHWVPAVSDCYRFALTPPDMDGVLCSLESEKHLTELAGALEKGPLAEDEVEYMIKLAALRSGQARIKRPG
ncbi:hypothetical protein HY251_14455 [bacterium]|nr:hypothetical protein [bacterium]